MRQKKNVMKQLNIPIPVIVIAVILVVSVTSVNVLVVRNSVKELVEEAMDDRVRDVCIDIDSKMEHMHEKAETVRGSVSAAQDEKELMQTLETIEKTSALYSVYYLKEDGTLYDGYRSIGKSGNGFTDILKIRSTLFKDDYYCYGTFINNESTNKMESVVLGVYRDTDEAGNTKGFFITAERVEDLLSDEEYDVFDEKASACLMNEAGQVYQASERFIEKFGDVENVYDSVFEYTNQSNTSKNKITQMRRYLNVNKTYNIYCKGRDGKQILIRGANIRSVEGLYIFVVYENGTMDEMLTPIMLVCFVCCISIVSVLFSIILLQMVVNYKNTAIMEELAYTDRVTDGYNLNYFKFKAPELIETNSENHYVMVRFDIANFRYINEAYGHVSADEILRSISEQFERIYSKKELCARINSDQFISLILNDVEMNEKNRKFEKIIGDKAKEAGVKYPIRFKKGIYKIRKEDNSIDIMIDHANAARKSLKGDEKILEAQYSDNIINDMKKNDAIESEMQSALTKGEFRPYLQPKWDIVKNRIVGAEILVRWIKDDGTVIFPSDFVPIFEQNGFVEKLDFYMLEKLCEKIREYKQKGDYDIVPVSINQSRILLGNPEYLKNVERIMNRYDTSIEDIQIEITESVFFNDREKMIVVIDQLKEMGLMLCMDDFGSGYSSLNLLKDVPFDILKIDKDFFSEAITSRDTVIIMRHIVEMAGELGIKVVCEGVETEKQIEMLREIGCNMVQGYYYSKPIPFDDFMEKYLHKDSTIKHNPEVIPDEEETTVGKEKNKKKEEELSKNEAVSSVSEAESAAGEDGSPSGELNTKEKKEE